MRLLGWCAAMIVIAAVGAIAFVSWPLMRPTRADDSLGQQVRQLDQRVKALESQVKTIEALLKLAGAGAPAAQLALTPPGAPAASTSADETSAPLRLVGWSATPKHEDYEDVYEMTYALANDSPKPIKLIDASLAFSDALGEMFFGFNLQKDVAIAPGGQESFHGSVRRNTFKPEEARLGTMNKADVVAKLIIRAVVFGDNSVAKFGQ